MLKLYGQYRSRAFRVVWMCKESDIPFEHVNVTINVEGATCKEPGYTWPSRAVSSAGRAGDS